MENVSIILDYIYENEKTTQRKISKNINLALGNINAILQMCINKGLIKIEKVNRNNIKYILTPEGMLEKTKYAYSFLQASVKRVLTLKNNLESILSNEELKYSQIVFYGETDDTKTYLKQIAEEMKMQNAVWTDDFEKLQEYNNALIILWQPEALQKCCEYDIKYVNILSYTSIKH